MFWPWLFARQDTQHFKYFLDTPLVGTGKGTATSVDGVYRFRDIPSGTYVVEVSFIGYSTQRREGVEIQNGQTTELDFVLSQQSLTPRNTSRESQSASEALSDIDPVILLLEINAKEGDVGAQFMLAMKYVKGDGVDKDYREAAKWFREAANQGDEKAQHNLALMYEFGEGVDQDYMQAAAWHRKAADQGYASSQLKLGLMYRTGIGVDKNSNTAIYWFQKAAEQDDTQAQFYLGTMYSLGKVQGDNIEPDYRKGAIWLRKAADKGMAEAQLNLGILYELGFGVPKNIGQARIWYRKAADQGIEQAIERLRKLN